MVEWPLEDSGTASVRWQYFTGPDKVLQEAVRVYALSQHPIYGIVSPIARIHESRKQGVEMEVANTLVIH